MAVQPAFNAFLPRILEESVILMSANATVVVYLKKQGGTVFRVMCRDCGLDRTVLGNFVRKIHSRKEERLNRPTESSTLSSSHQMIPPSPRA